MKMVITLNVPNDTNYAERLGRISKVKLDVAEAVRKNMILDDPFDVQCVSVRTSFEKSPMVNLANTLFSVYGCNQVRV